MSLYDEHKERFDEIAHEAPNVAAMARHFDRHQDMCDALLFDRSTVQHWIKGRSRVSPGAERRAEMWLKTGGARTQATEPAAAPLASSQLYLIAVPSGADDKVRKVLGLLGCEIVDM